MKRTRVIALSEADAWRAAIADLPHSYLHRPEWCHAIARSSGIEPYLAVFDASHARIVCPLAERVHGGERDVFTPFGIAGFAGVADYPNFAADWSAFVADRGYVTAYVCLNPLFERAGWYRPEDVGSSRSLFVIDLRRPLDAILAAFSRGRRRELEASAAPRVVRQRDRLVRFLADHQESFLANRGAALPFHVSAATWAALAGDTSTLVSGIESDGEVASALLVVTSAYCADAVFTATAAGRDGHLAHLLWDAMRELHGRGVPWLNLGGCAHEGDGIEAFKLRFGAERRPMRALCQVLRREPFERLCRSAGVAPTREAYFPPYHSPALSRTARASS